jgi:hypothetical protein
MSASRWMPRWLKMLSQRAYELLTV